MAIFITEADPAFPERGGTNPVADLGGSRDALPLSAQSFHHHGVFGKNCTN